MKDGTTAQGRTATTRLGRWLQPRHLATVGVSSLLVGGGLFGVLSHVLPANAASFNVTTTTDSALSPSNATTCNSPCSLRAAIEASNNAGGTNTINVPAGTYNLTSSLGELQIGPSIPVTVTISGAGAASTIIHAQQPSTCTSSAPATCFRVFDVDPGVAGNRNVTLIGVTVSGGRTNQFGGAGLITGATGPVDNTTITNCIFDDNVLYSTATNVPGGGISQVFGALTVSGSTFTNNSAGGGPGGAIDLEETGSVLTLSNSSFSGNRGDVGGAVALSSGNSITSSITNSTFTGNTATISGGALDMGGAAYTVNMSGSTMTGNTAPTGGAVHDGGGTLNLDYSRIYNNTATTNGAINNASATVNANTDWWGFNTGPGTATNFTPTNWQVLTVTPSAAAILVNTTDTVTADLDHTHTGGTIAPAHHLPDGIPVSFGNGTLGTVSPTSGTLSSGSASTTYTAGSTGGLDHPTATIDGQQTQTTIEVDQPPHITSGSSATFLVGASVSCSGTLSNCFHVTAAGYPPPTFSETGALPPGVTLTSAGVLSGSPTACHGGVYNIVITATNHLTATNQDATDTQNFTLTVNEAPSITSANNTTFTTGQAGTFTVTDCGYPAPSVTLTSGSLPGGVTYDSSTHVLSGTPSSGTGGQYALQFTAHNSSGTDAVQSFTLTIDQPPAITSAATTTFTVGSAGTFTVTTTGFPHASLNDGGATLPSGVTFTDNGNGTATLAGTPAAGTGGTYSFTITASNGVTPNATQSFTLTVDEAASVISANHTTFTTGQAGTFSVTSRGFPTPTLSDGGATLPSGVTFVDNGDGTATLAGTPAAGTGGTYTFTITAHNGIGADGTQSFTLTVDQPPAITSAATTTFTVGSAGTFTVTTTGFPAGASMSITESGTLPSGVTFTDNHDGTATLAGTPGNSTAGDYPVSIGASNGVAPDASQNFTLHVLGTPHITSADHTTFVVGQAGTFTVTTTGSLPMTISDGGATLPGGVTFTDNGDGTATLAGTPAAGSAGTYSFTITAHNSAPPDATQGFTLQVNEAPAITSADHTTFTVGTAGTFTVTTTGTPTPSISDGSATLPSGVAFVDNGDGTATLSGTPAAGTGGTYSFTITAHNGVGSDATQPFTLTVDEAPSLTSADHATFTVGSAGTFTVQTAGFPAPGISETGTLPGGITFTDNGDGTATLSGTPASGTGGTYSLSFKASNGVGSDATQSFTLTVDEAPSIASAASTTFTVGTAGSFNVTTGGFPAPSLSDGGAVLPSGVTFVDNGDGTATLSGTPATGTGGTYSFTIAAHNGVGSDATQPFTLTVNEAPSFTSADHATFTVGTAGTFHVSTDGFPAPSIGESGALPGGVTFTDNGNGTATLAGTPAVGSGGTYTLRLTASNGIGTDATQTFTLTVDEAVAITSANNTTFTVGAAGTFKVTTRGFPIPSLSDGGALLPSGVTFADNGDGTATLSGTPAAGTGGTYSFTITAHNGQSTDATQPFTLTVDEAASITSASSTTFTVGTAGSFTVTTSGFPAPSIGESGALPGGVTFTDNGNGTATLAGTPGAGSGGVYHISFTAHNGIGSDGTQNFTLTVDQAAAITSANSTTFTAGSSNTFSVTTTGFPTPSISEVGSLPGGLSFVDNGNGTGTLSGTPNTGTGGVYHISFTAHNGVGSDATQSFTLTVDEAAAITSANTVTFQVNTFNSFTVTTRGFPTPSLSESGTLPSGVSFTDNGNGTGTLSGTPGSGTSSSYPITFTAHNGVGSDGTQNFTLIVGAAPTTTTVTASTTTPTYGSNVTFTATVAPVSPATGTPAGTVTFSVDGVQQATVTLNGSAQAQWTTNSLQQGPHTIRADYNGQANTFKPSFGTVNVTVGCTTNFTGTIKGGVTITGGSACVDNAKISGGVSISGGASVSIVGSTIGNGITSNGARMLAVCGDSTASGSILVGNSTGFVLIGGAGDDPSFSCGTNTVGGGITLSGNSGGFEIGGNSVKGAVTVNNNVLSLGTPLDSENATAEIEANTIKGSLSCSGNNPAPIDDLKPNHVSGGRSGQCGAANF